jgi:hypothetical protein
MSVQMNTSGRPSQIFNAGLRRLDGQRRRFRLERSGMQRNYQLGRP